MLLLKFAKYGILCFGGGYMIIPLLFDDYVKNTKFFTLEEFGNLLSISQLTPGAVSINTATYVGFLEGKIFGAILATLGLILPTFILSVFILTLIKKYENSFCLKGCVQGGKFVSVVMIAFASILFCKMSLFVTGKFMLASLNMLTLCVFFLSFLLSLKAKISAFKILISALLFGIFVGYGEIILNKIFL